MQAEQMFALRPHSADPHSKAPASPKEGAAGSPTHGSNGAALSGLYRREAAALRRFVRGIVGDLCDAEDIVQETFVRVARAQELRPIADPRAVLFRTARNLGLNLVRDRRGRNSPETRFALAVALWSSQATAEDQMIASEQDAAHRALLGDLPRRCRDALELRFVDELSYKQISSRMRLSVSTVEKHVGRGKHIYRLRALAGAALDRVHSERLLRAARKL